MVLCEDCGYTMSYLLENVKHNFCIDAFFISRGACMVIGATGIGLLARRVYGYWRDGYRAIGATGIGVLTLGVFIDICIYSYIAIYEYLYI
jgi:hypothetical protein